MGLGWGGVGWGGWLLALPHAPVQNHSKLAPTAFQSKGFCLCEAWKYPQKCPPLSCDLRKVLLTTKTEIMLNEIEQDVY